MCTSIAPLGHPPTKTPGQISDQAQAWYQSYNGSNGPENMDGMSLEQLYSLLRQVGIHYRELPMTDSAIAGALSAGYPVIVSVAETSVFDTALGRNPYPWTPQGNHVIVITGIHTATQWDVRDSANIAAPNSLRAGPRFYDRQQLQYVSVTAIGGSPVSQVPQGWHDDGHTLMSPAGIPVVLGFRDYVLNNQWNPSNVPLRAEFHLSQLEQANPALGGGQQQPFKLIVLEYPDNERKVIEMWTGQEVMSLQLLVANLKAQLAASDAKTQAAIDELDACQNATAAVPVVNPTAPLPADYTKVKIFLDAQILAMQSFDASL